MEIQDENFELAEIKRYPNVAATSIIEPELNEYFSKAVSLAEENPKCHITAQ